MELCQPRWSEDPAAVDQLVRETRVALERGTPSPHGKTESWPQIWQRVVHEAKLPPLLSMPLEREVQTLHTYLALREPAKHYLLQGYALIRRILVELDRRFGLDGGIFYLTPEELPLLGTQPMTEQIAKRRRRRELALRIAMPQVLFSDDLEAIGREMTASGD